MQTGEHSYSPTAMSARVLSNLGPVYLRIAQDLINEIEAGRLKPGDAVPSERVLCERYGVSRMTARHAVQTL
ncbi:MAG: GntR family transcriptional regulator, partial [Thermomicrobiales bacterium]|nr:GntR family transcriptional regulator [Thermomicrobiales bacterium]